MNLGRKLAVATVAIIAGLAGTAAMTPVSAELVTASSDPFAVVWSCSTCTSATTLSGTAEFSNFIFSGGGTTFTMDITIENTTSQGSLSISDWDSIRLTAFGFDTVPDATSGSTTSSVSNLFLETNFPSFNTVDVCSSSGPSCEGGGSGGLFPSGTGLTPFTNTFTLTLSGLPPGTSQIDLGTDASGGSELFDVKFQTAFGSFEFQNPTCIPGTPGCTPFRRAPEPNSLAIMGLGLLALGLAFRRAKRTGPRGIDAA